MTPRQRSWLASVDWLARARFASAIAVLILAGLIPANATTAQQKPVAGKPVAGKPAVGKPAVAKPTPTKQAPQAKKNRPPLPRRTVHAFTTGDGSRFVLVQDPGMQQVHWAIASWADGSDDPAGLPGLTQATMKLSLAGTWSTGSKDPTAERDALRALGQAWQRQIANPRDQQTAAEIVRLDRAARELSDPRTFLRVMAALPVLQPQILDRDPIAILVLTTIEPALADVAKLLLERREQQALRGLARMWMPTVMERLRIHSTHPRNSLHAEVLALLMPFSPAIARLEAPPLMAPSHEQAIAAWQASQYPTRTVHALFGSFDVEQTKATLEKVFATTSLPTPTPHTRRAMRQGTAQRRSIVPNVPGGGLAIAWVLPAIQDPWALKTAIRWLGEGANSQLHVRLTRKRPQLTLQCRAPWPRTQQGQGLLLIDVQDPSGQPGLLEDVLEACHAATAKSRPSGHFYRANLSLQRDWNAIADNPRAVAATFAQQTLMWPTVAITGTAPVVSDGSSVSKILLALFASQPAIVETKQ